MFRPLLAILAILSPVVSSSLWAQSNNLFVGPSTLTFNGTVKGIPTGAQSISASSSTTPIALNVTVEYIGTPTCPTASQWLRIDQTTGITPFLVNAYADPSSLTLNCTYQARINFQGSFGATVFVNFVVGTGTGGSSAISVSPTSFNQSASSGGGVISQQLSINSTTSGVAYVITTATTAGGNWLSVTNGYQSSGSTPALVSISMDPTGLYSQTYTGYIYVTPVNGGTAVTIPVTLNVNGVTASGFALSTTSVPVNYQIGTAYPAQQSIFVSNSLGQTAYTATSSQSWALLSTPQSTVPASTVNGLSGYSLLITINPSGLTASTYTSNISFVATTGQTLNATVTLNVTTSGFFNASPSSLTFNYNPGYAPANQSVSISSSTGASINFSANANSNGGWLAVTPSSGNTYSSNVLTVSIQNVALNAGTYSGSITVTDFSSGVSTVIPVTMNYGVTGGTNQLSIVPGSVTLTSPVGGGPVSQVMQVASYSGANQNFHVLATSTPNWLSVAPGVGVTPATITVVASASAIASAGTYTGNIVFTNFDGTQQTIPVTFTVTTNVALAAAPNSLAFTQAIGTQAPAAKRIDISAANGPNTNYSATSSANWLTVTPAGGTTPGAISVSVSAANLAQGTYSGSITIVGGINQLVIPVSFTVMPANSISLSTTAINFNYQAGTAAPAPQVINVTSPGASVPFISAFTTSIGGNWLSVSQSANSTPATLTVTANPVSMANGIYPGTITISASDGSGQKITVNVNLTVTAPPAPVISRILNAATQQPTWLSPGLIIVVQGIGLGPANFVTGTLLAPGAVDTVAGGTRILFDGVPAPILAAKSDGVFAVVPYEVRGKSTATMIVEYQGIQSAPYTMSVQDSAPGIFTRDASGAGQAAANNENGLPNSPANPAAQGSVVSVFGTGEGDTRPIGQDGRVIVTDLRVPILPVRVFLNGRELEVLYAGSAPGFVSGAFQVNVRIPDNLPATGSLPIELQVGPRASQLNITIAIR